VGRFTQSKSGELGIRAEAQREPGTQVRRMEQPPKSPVVLSTLLGNERLLGVRMQLSKTEANK